MMHMLSKDNTKLPLAETALREVDIKGGFLYPGDRYETKKDKKLLAYSNRPSSYAACLTSIT